MNHHIFSPADILLFTGDRTAFSVVACDQYTSEPEYWERVLAATKDKPSACHLIFPEIYLKTADFDAKIREINRNMADYLARGLFQELENSLIYVERSLRNGKIRRGLIGRIDLEEYDYSVGSESKIRATEGTVLERIPPRVKIRENAPLELPHVMLLIDDAEKSVIEPLSAKTGVMQPLYDFPLMENSGSLRGWALPHALAEQVLAQIDPFGDPDQFAARYGTSEKAPLQFAVGDGNHSLATARKCYLNLKESIGEEAARNHPARYALVELVNLHDDSLEFEAIHRIVTGVNPDDVIEAFSQRYPLSDHAEGAAQKVIIVIGQQKKTVYLTKSERQLAVGSVQAFLDEYLASHPGEVDYIHGEDVVCALCERPDSIGFLFDAMGKDMLFKTVILDGALPRKTFSMGEACDKRFYFEARKIK